MDLQNKNDRISVTINFQKNVREPILLVLDQRILKIFVQCQIRLNVAIQLDIFGVKITVQIADRLAGDMHFHIQGPFFIKIAKINLFGIVFPSQKPPRPGPAKLHPSLAIRLEKKFACTLDMVIERYIDHCKQSIALYIYTCMLVAYTNKIVRPLLKDARNYQSLDSHNRIRKLF